MSEFPPSRPSVSKNDVHLDETSEAKGSEGILEVHPAERKRILRKMDW
jgi:hypothetical protein